MSLSIWFSLVQLLTAGKTWDFPEYRLGRKRNIFARNRRFGKIFGLWGSGIPLFPRKGLLWKRFLYRFFARLWNWLGGSRGMDPMRVGKNKKATTDGCL